MKVQELFDEVDRLPNDVRWRLLKHVLRSLENEQAASPPQATDWHTFLRATYGSLRDTPIRRWETTDSEMGA
jgi:hypothetical protein